MQVITFHLENNDRGVEMIRSFIVSDQSTNMTRNFEIVIKLLAVRLNDAYQYNIAFLENPSKRNLLFLSNLLLLVYLLEDLIYENSSLVKVNPKSMVEALGSKVNNLSRLKHL